MASNAPLKKEKHKDRNTPQQRFQNTVMKIIEWIMSNLKIIGMVAGVIVIVIVITMSWLSYQKGKDSKALALEAKAFDLHQNAQTQAAQESSDSTPDETPQAGNPYQETIETYLELIEQYPGTKSAERALYLLGSIEYERENYEKAQEYFSTYMTKYPKGELQTHAEKSIGYILEQQAKHQQAIDQFKRLEAKISTTDKAEVQLAIGRNYEVLQQFDEAVSVYQEIIDSNTSALWKNTAKERLDILRPPKETPVTETAKETPAEVKESEKPAVEETTKETAQETSEEQPAGDTEETPVAEQDTADTEEEPAAEQTPGDGENQ